MAKNRLKKNNTPSKSKRRIIIGIIGTHKGAGVTYFGLLFASYIKKILGSSVAFLEFGSKDDLSYIQEEYDGFKENDEFIAEGIGFYRRVNMHNISDIFNESYDYFILDLGIGLKYKEEYQRCDLNCIVGNLTYWKKHYFIEFIKEAAAIKGNERWKYFISYGEKRAVSHLSSELKKPIYIIPYVSNPFIINMEVVELLQNIL